MRYEIPVDVQTKALIAKYMKYNTKIPITLYADGETADMYDDEGVYMLTVNKVKEACISLVEATDAEKAALVHHDERKQQQIADVIEFENNVIEDMSIIRGGDRFGIDMATNRYNQPKKEYNNKQEEAINIAVKSIVKSEKVAMRATKKEEQKKTQDANDRHMALIEKKRAIRLNQQNQ